MQKKPQAITQYTQANRAAWNEVMPLIRKERHKQHPLLTAQLAQQQYCVLHELERQWLETVKVKDKKIAHLCCNNGLDLLSIMNLGAAEGIGFDISDVAISQAQEYAKLAKTNCTFVRADLYSIDPTYYNAFDIVYLNMDSLRWLPDIKQAFCIIDHLLKIGGQLLLIDSHPLTNTLPHHTPEHSTENSFLNTYFDQPPQSKSGLDSLQGEGSAYTTFHHNLTDILSALLANGLVLQHFKEYPQDITGQYQDTEKCQLMPLSFSLSALRTEKCTQKISPGMPIPGDFPPIFQFKYLNEKLRHYLLIQQSRHVPTYRAWGTYGEHFSKNTGDMGYTMPDWEPYQKLCERASQSYRLNDAYDYLIVDQLYGALDKLSMFKEFLSTYEVLEALPWTQDENHPGIDTKLYLIRTPKNTQTKQWERQTRPGFVSCYPSVFRLLPFIYGSIEQTTKLSISQTTYQAARLEIKAYIEQLKKNQNVHLLFALVSDVLDSMPTEIFIPCSPEGHHFMGILYSQIDNMLNQEVDTSKDFDALCLHHEMIHHALFMLCMLRQPYTYQDFIHLADRLNHTYYADTAQLNTWSFIYPNTTLSIMEPMLWIHQAQGLKIHFSPLASNDEKCEPACDEVLRALKTFETQKAPNVVITGFTPESTMEELTATHLKASIEHGLSAHSQITVLVHMPFFLSQVLSLIWSELNTLVNTGKINLLITESWHKYKGFGIEKCLAARLIVINNNACQLRGLTEFLEKKQQAMFDHHPELQYMLAIIEQGFKHERNVIHLVTSNRDEILKIDQAYAIKTKKPPMFFKASILLTTQVEEKYILQTNIKAQLSFGFPFTSYKTFYDPRGASMWLSIGMEPIPLMFAKLKPMFEAYYASNFTRPDVNTVLDLNEDALPINTHELRPQAPTMDSKLAEKNHAPPSHPMEAPEKPLPDKTLVSGTEAPLEATIASISQCFKRWGIALLQTDLIKSPKTGFYSTTLGLAHCPLLSVEGKAGTAKAAQASALGGLIERVSNNLFWNFRYLKQEAQKNPFIYFPHETWISVKEKNWQQEILAPELRAKYTKMHYLTPGALTDINSMPEDPCLCAMPYVRQADQKIILFPNTIVNHFYFCNGLAAGNSPHEARIHALGEIFRRYVKRSVMEKKLCLPNIPKAAFSDFPAIMTSLCALESAGFEVWVKDASFNRTYPVINVTVRHKSNGRCHACYGSAPDLQTALERSLREMLQVTSEQPPLTVEQTENQASHPELTGTGVLHPRFFKKTPDFAYRPWRDFGNTDSTYTAYCDILSRFGLNVYIADYKHLGYYTCHMIVPGFSEFFFFNPKERQHIETMILPIRELLLHLPELSAQESQEVLSYMNACNLPPTKSMNEALGLHAKGNGFWDWSTIEEVLFLLEKKSAHSIATVTANLTHPYSLKDLMNIAPGKQWPPEAQAPTAFDFSLQEQHKIIMTHDQLQAAKAATYSPES